MVNRYTVDDRGIDIAFSTGQMVWRAMAMVGTEHLNASIAFAPARSGHLKAAHYPVPIMTPRGKRGWRYTLRNDAPYSEYVHDGTTGPIMAYGDYLTVPMTRGSDWPRFLARSVAGQTANPWFEKAWNYVAP